MKNLIIIFFIMIMAVSFSPCMTTKTSVGEFNDLPGRGMTYAKGNQFWLFWGIVPVGRTDVPAPSHGNCQVVTKFRISDFLISGITGGLLTTYSIEVRVKH